MLNKYLTEFGYSQDKISKIITNYELIRYKENTLLIKIKVINAYLLTFLTKEQVIKLTTKFPQIYGYNLTTIKDKLDYLENLGYSKDNMIKIILGLPNILAYSSETIEETINLFLNLGIKKQDIFKITVKFPAIYSHRDLAKKINYLTKLGFSLEEIAKMIVKFPQILSFHEDNILNTFNFLLSIQIPKIVVLKMLTISPQIFGYNNLKIKETIDIFEYYSYTYSDILVILMEFPSILSKSKSSLTSQLEFYKQENLEYLIIKNPRNLIQSISLTRKRLDYLRDNNISFNYQSLYLNSNDFNKRFIENKRK